MPAVLSQLTFQGSRVRGLSAPIAPDEPLRKTDSASGGAGANLTWRVLTASASLVIEDSNNAVAIDSATPVNLTVPADADVTFAIGVSILIEQRGTGQITVVAGIGVTLDYRAAFTNKLAGRFAPATVIKKSANRWLLSGDLGVAP